MFPLVGQILSPVSSASRPRFFHGSHGFLGVLAADGVEGGVRRRAGRDLAPQPSTTSLRSVIDQVGAQPPSDSEIFESSLERWRSPRAPMRVAIWDYHRSTAAGAARHVIHSFRHWSLDRIDKRFARVIRDGDACRRRVRKARSAWRGRKAAFTPTYCAYAPCLCPKR